jgi:type IV pilus assembly protein PilA
MLMHNKGFTLIELTVVIAVIGILSAVAIPNFIAYRDRAYLGEGYALSGPVRKEVMEYYDHRGEFPADNAALGLPEAVRGKYVESIKVSNGDIEIKYKEESRQRGVTITLRPFVSSDDPTGPVTWEEEKSSRK